MSQPELVPKPQAALEPEPPQVQPAAECATDLSAAQLLDLRDEAKQTEYRRQYLLHLQQCQGCLGCGD